MPRHLNKPWKRRKLSFHNTPDLMIFLPVPFATPLFDDMVALRTRVLRDPLGLKFTPEQLAAEWDQRHFACLDQNWNLKGCLTLVGQEKGRVKMRQVAVDPASQGKGVGQFMVEQSEAWAREHGFGIMALHARKTAVPFYEKLGYRTEGEEFEEVGIPHFSMTKNLAY